MACPHGKNSTPDTCSQCRMVTPVVIQVKDGWIYEDGKPKMTLRQRTTEQMNEEQDGNAPARHRVCGRCHLPGHNAATCNRPTVIDPDHEVAEEN